VVAAAARLYDGYTRMRHAVRPAAWPKPWDGWGRAERDGEKHIHKLCIDIGALGEEQVDEAEVACGRRPMEKGQAVLRWGGPRTEAEREGVMRGGAA
jgi:hypothetical protein